jgi:hypothetical protein
MSFQVRIEDAGLFSFVEQFPNAFRNATRSAIGTTTTWAKKQADKRLSEANKTPDKTFKKFRDKKFFNDGYKSGKSAYGKIWIGYNKVRAKRTADNSFLGKLIQERDGAWAGNYYFPKAFVATFDSGHTAIFKRLNKLTRSGKWKPEEQSANMARTIPTIDSMMPDVTNELMNRFNSKVSDYISSGRIPSPEIFSRFD